jgi:hypothetical protein
MMKNYREYEARAREQEDRLSRLLSERRVKARPEETHFEAPRLDYEQVQRSLDDILSSLRAHQENKRRRLAQRIGAIRRNEGEDVRLKKEQLQREREDHLNTMLFRKLQSISKRSELKQKRREEQARSLRPQHEAVEQRERLQQQKTESLNKEYQEKLKKVSRQLERKRQETEEEQRLKALEARLRMEGVRHRRDIEKRSLQMLNDQELRQLFTRLPAEPVAATHRTIF